MSKEEMRWDLSQLVDSTDPVSVRRTLEAMVAEAGKLRARAVSNPSSDPFLEFSILFSKFLFQDDLFSPDEDEPEYNVDHN